MLKSVQKFATTYFTEHEKIPLAYHNLEHTEYVVKAVQDIGGHYNLDRKDQFIVETTAWFHDLGMLTVVDGHEEVSAQIARDYLEQEAVEEEVISKICGLILATKVPQQPVGFLEEIICDADMYHLGKKSFFKKSESLRRERESMENTAIPKSEWILSTIEFMKNHHYQTDFCRTELDEHKEDNMNALKDEYRALDRASSRVHEHAKEKGGHESHSEKDGAALHESGKEKMGHEPHPDKDRPEKGIETMFRITSSNNQRLSDMADNKAHILITVNSIILSAIISWFCENWTPMVF